MRADSERMMGGLFDVAPSPKAAPGPSPPMCGPAAGFVGLVKTATLAVQVLTSTLLRRFSLT